jgi:hypothetical protein
MAMLIFDTGKQTQTQTLKNEQKDERHKINARTQQKTYNLVLFSHLTGIRFVCLKIRWSLSIASGGATKVIHCTGSELCGGPG